MTTRERGLGTGGQSWHRDPYSQFGLPYREPPLSKTHVCIEDSCLHRWLMFASMTHICLYDSNDRLSIPQNQILHSTTFDFLALTRVLPRWLLSFCVFCLNDSCLPQEDLGPARFFLKLSNSFESFLWTINKKWFMYISFSFPHHDLSKLQPSTSLASYLTVRFVVSDSGRFPLRGIYEVRVYPYYDASPLFF